MSVEECDRFLTELNRAPEPVDARALFGQQEWELLMNSLFPPATKEDERDELLSAEVQRQLEAIAGQPNVWTSDSSTPAASLTHTDKAISKIEPIQESFDQDEELDLLALFGPEEQEWMSGLAPPLAEEEEREEPEPVLEPQQGSTDSTGQ